MVGEVHPSGAVDAVHPLHVPRQTRTPKPLNDYWAVSAATGTVLKVSGSPKNGIRDRRVVGQGSGRSPGYVTATSVMAFGKSEELLVMNRSAPAATAVAR